MGRRCHAAVLVDLQEKLAASQREWVFVSYQYRHHFRFLHEMFAAARPRRSTTWRTSFSTRRCPQATTRAENTPVRITQSSIALFERVDDFGSVVGRIRLLGAVLGRAIDGLGRGCRSAFLAPTGDEANAQQGDHNDLQVCAVHKTPKLSSSAGESPSPGASAVAMLTLKPHSAPAPQWVASVLGGRGEGTRQAREALMGAVSSKGLLDCI